MAAGAPLRHHPPMRQPEIDNAPLGPDTADAALPAGASSSESIRPSVQWRQEGASLRGIGTGCWTLDQLPLLEQALTPPALAAGQSQAVLDLTGVVRLDTSGAWVAERLAVRLQEQGLSVTLEAGPHRLLLARVEQAGIPALDRVPRRWLPRPLATLERLGAVTLREGAEVLSLIGFFGQVSLSGLSLLLRPAAFRFTDTVAHMQRTGVAAMPIVGLLAFLIGVTLAYQTAFQLQRFGAVNLTINVVGVSVVREFGILLTAIIVAGRSGSAFCAQIGTMTVNEEVDALRTLGMEALEVLVLPRVLALVLIMPLLAFYADIMAILGGGIYMVLSTDYSVWAFLEQLQRAIKPSAFWVGLIKAPVFGFLVALVGCHEGLRVQGGAAGVGSHTTRAVVASIFLIILSDALFSILFTILGV